MIDKKYMFGFILIFYVMIANPTLMIESVKKSLFVCYSSVIPSLYIFMVFSSYFSQKSFMNVISKSFNFYGRLLKIEDKKYSVYLLLSLFGGFAIGAKFLNLLKSKGYSKNSLYAIAPSLINNSFSFVVYAVGVGMFGSFRLGILLFISLISASLITSFILSFIFEYDIVQSKVENVKLNKTIVECINDSVNSILSICGFVILSFYICEVVVLYSQKLSFQGPLLCPFIEVTTGCIKIIEDIGKNPLLICGSLSLVPLSTISQVSFFFKDNSILKPLIFSRIIHTPLSMFIFSLMIKIFPVSDIVNSTEIIAVDAFYNTMEISSVLFILTVVFLIIFDNNKIFTKIK